MYARLKRIRREAGISAAKLAGAVGVSAQSVFNWESRKTFPSGRHLLAVQDYLIGIGAIGPGTTLMELYELDYQPADDNRTLDMFQDDEDDRQAAAAM